MPADPVPGDHQATVAVLALLKTSSWLLHELSPVFAEHKISATRFDALDALSRRGGAARPAELRDMLHLPAQTITGVLDQLQAAGLVTRSPHPGDRRSTIAELTPAGRDIVERICPPLIDVEEDCMSGLTPGELHQLTGLLTKIQQRIAQRRSAAATRRIADVSRGG
jgi:DNA-binding MarR family transcriptional regulator